MKEKITAALLLLWAYGMQICAQTPNWEHNPYDYRYDMTAYISLSINGQDVTDYTSLTIGAFCGDECRGIAEEKQSNGHKYIYLRIRSNQPKGEDITFLVRNTRSGITAHSTNVITFESQSVIGYPSSPYKIEAFYQEVDKTLLEQALQAAKAIDTQANVGDAPFQIPQSALTPLLNAIASAQQVYDDPTADADTIADAAATLLSAIDTSKSAQLNKPGDEPYNITSPSSGNALTIKSPSDPTLIATTTIGWTDAPGSHYPQAIHFTPVSDTTNGYILSYQRADGITIYVGTTADADTNPLTTTTDKAKAQTIIVTPSTTQNNVWHLYTADNSGNRHPITGSNQQGNPDDAAAATLSDLTLSPAQPHTLTISIDNKYGTLIAPFDIPLHHMPEGLTAYSVTRVEGDELKLTLESGIQANTPYILNAYGTVTHTFTGHGTAYSDPTYTSGLLTGVYTREVEVPTGSYALQTKDDGIQAFYLVARTYYATPNRAYLTVPPPADAAAKAAFYFGFDDTPTLIASPHTDGDDPHGSSATPTDAPAFYYTLSGQRIAAPTHPGIYILGGRKVLIK